LQQDVLVEPRVPKRTQRHLHRTRSRPPYSHKHENKINTAVVNISKFSSSSCEHPHPDREETERGRVRKFLQTALPTHPLLFLPTRGIPLFGARQACVGTTPRPTPGSPSNKTQPLLGKPIRPADKKEA
ncbi:unnamed protein product, partial [Ectocarpus sp. 12 AP-2014]